MFLSRSLSEFSAPLIPNTDDPKKYVMAVEFFNKQVISHFETSYIRRHGSNPFNDLKQNWRFEVINNGECVIWSGYNDFLFIFHNYVALGVRVRSRNKKNLAKVARSEAELLKFFIYV
jgi:hypothetical protein